MKNAFGVQREIKVADSPKGTSFIAREFTPGRPTLVKEIRQNTIDKSKQTVEFTDAMTEDEKKESIDPSEENDGSGSEAMPRHQRQEIVESSIEETLEVNTAEKATAQEDATEDEKEKSLAEPEETVAEIDKTKEENRSV